MDANEARWCKAMESLGPEIVRMKLASNAAGPGPGAEIRFIVDRDPLPLRSFVEQWLAEQDATDRKHKSRVDFWTLVLAAAGAAVGTIAASVIAFFVKP